MKINLLKFSLYITALASALAVVSYQYGQETALGSFLCLSLLAVGFRRGAIFGVVPRLDQIVGRNQGNQQSFYGSGPISVEIPVATLTTATAPADIATVILPPNIGRYIVLGYTIEAITAAGTVAAATIAVRTAAAGAGNVVVTATALTGVTAIDLACTTNMGLTGQVVNAATVTTLTVRQTVDSANAGTVRGFVTIQPVP